VAAYSSGMRFNEWIKLAVEEKLGRIKAAAPAPPVEVTGPELVAPESIPACDVCGSKCVQWGPSQRHCTRCSRNFPLKGNEK
jgi:hypothetical protein